MFEEYGFKGVYISIQAVLTLYAQGKKLILLKLNNHNYEMTVHFWNWSFDAVKFGQYCTLWYFVKIDPMII